MATAVAAAVVSRGLTLVPLGLTGDQVAEEVVTVAGVDVRLVRPADREATLAAIAAEHPSTVVVDYTHPSAVNANVAAYAAAGLSFVVGTTGGDEAAMRAAVATGDGPAAGAYALIAPNMAKQIVALQAALEAAAAAFPGAYAGYTLSVTESHQSHKADTSGTAKANVAAFGALGAPLAVADIVKVRSPDAQVAEMGVPADALAGHAFHTYRLVSADGSVRFELQHNVVGRAVYAEGTVDAVVFLAARRDAGDPVRLYNMIDVLRAGEMS